MALLKSLVLGLVLAIVASAMNSSAQPTLGDAPLAPTDLSGLPGRGPHPLFVTGSISVDTTSREQAREFYNAIYSASTGIPINSSAVTAQCLPGTNSPLFVDATLLRLNWFRAMAGVPAAVTFDPTESSYDQAGALMMSGEDMLQHTGDWTGWDCYSENGTNAAANSNLALGSDGPDAITGYIWDFGASNFEVGHRRWLIYPQTQIMATGDVPAEGTNLASNATWVFDANYNGPRPATRTNFVSWPPAGYVPYQVVFPQWSFALSNANLSAATVTMSSNGVAVPVTVQPYETSYGEDTLVWYPSSLDPTTNTTVFPFSGTDTVYSITVGNVTTPTSTNSYTYSVTLIDPGVTGTGFVPLVVSGTNAPLVGIGNSYFCTTANNPNTTGYQWLTSVATNGNLVDNALNGLTNFSISPTPPPYSVIVAAPASAGGSNCFHLCHAAQASQYLQLNKALYPSTNSTFSFKSMLGYAYTNQIAEMQISTNTGATWLTLFSEAGNTTGSVETFYTQHTYSLSNFAGEEVLARFAYILQIPASGSYSYYPQTNNNVGWCIDNIIVTNSQQLLGFTTNITSSTNFTFTPTATNSYVLQAQGEIFNQFLLDLGPLKEVTAVNTPLTLISLSAPLISSGQVKIKFALTSGTPPSFHLLQASQIAGPWTTNGTAVLTTNVVGSSFQFATTNSPGMQFYKVQVP